jgi:hypothetical protein
LALDDYIAQLSRNKMAIQLIRMKLVYSLFVMLAFALALDMGGEFGVRTLLLFPGVFSIFILIKIKWHPIHLLSFILFVVYPSILMVGASLGLNDLGIALSQFKATVFGFFLLILISSIRDRELLFDGIIRAFVMVAIISNILIVGVMLDIQVASDIIQTLSFSGGGYFGDRVLSNKSLVTNLYFKSTLFMPSVFLISIYRRKYFGAVLILFASIFSFSKMAFIASMLILFFYIIFRTKGSVKKLVFIGLFLFIFSYGTYGIGLFQEVQTLFTSRHHTVHVRIDHYYSLISFWSANPFQFIFGSGLGSSFFSNYYGVDIYNIEIDHLNIIRKYGVIWFIVFSFFVIYAIWCSFNSRSNYKKYMGISVMVAFIIAGTNPVLISPMFFLFIAVILPTSVEYNCKLVYAE